MRQFGVWVSLLFIGCGVPVDEAEPVLSEPLLTIPLGETIFFDGDDYLSFWGADHPDPVTVLSAPDGALATLAGDGQRLTPDLPGEWVFQRGGEEVAVHIDAAPLDSDHFLNYNYTPVTPIAPLDDNTMLVATPTGNSVQRVVVDVDGAAVATRIPTGAWPTSVVEWPGSGYVLVAQTGRDTLGFLDLDSLSITDAIRVGDEPAGIVVNGDEAYVTISGDDRVVRVDLSSREVTASADVGTDPRAMQLDLANNRLFVASLMSSNEHPLGRLQVEVVPEELQRDIMVIDLASFEVIGKVGEVGTMIRGLHLTDTGRLIAAVSHSHNDKFVENGDAGPHSHGLAIMDVDPASESWEPTHVDLDAQPSATSPAPSPYTMAMTPDGSQLLVTLSAGAAVLALDPVTFEEVGRVTLGNDPRGLRFSNGRAWTNAWLDNTLEGFALPVYPGMVPEVVLDLADDPRPPDVKEGQRLFNDAEFSGTRNFSCNNCHIDGLADGLVWDLLADGNVNTLAFRNIAGTDPFLWGAQLPTLFDFSREVLKLVGADATGEEMELLTVYMQSVTAPPNPYALPGGRLSDSALNGEQIFHGSATGGGAGCGACHSGPLYTNRSQVLGKTEGKVTDVPALIGVYDTAPYGREGQWRTLDEMIDYAIGFTGAELSADEVVDLSEFIREIPGDALYLNSALPLSGADHVWVETGIELVFSQVLAPGQEDLFTIDLVTPGMAEPVAGQWAISGRYGRFVPRDGLDLEASYRITVQPGLEASLGQILYEPIKLEWRVGGLPELDVSGKWAANMHIDGDVLGPLIGYPYDVEVGGNFALIQASGGNVTGVITTDIDEATIDHIEGVTSGEVLVLEPFRFASVIGEILVDGGQFDMVDEDGDGWAEYGTGTVESLGFQVPVEMWRTSFPDEDQNR